MPIFDASRFLRNVLFADAASCLASGALQILFTAALAGLLNLAPSLLAGTGWFLCAYGALVAFTACRNPLPRAFVPLFIAGNLAWAAGCAALLAGQWQAPTALGKAWIVAQALTVAVLAFLQWNGLKGGRPAGWA